MRVTDYEFCHVSLSNHTSMEVQADLILHNFILHDFTLID
jgi:hypothetical protein